MKIELVEIPGLPTGTQSTWKLRALVIDGKSLAIEALKQWKDSEKADYRKIMKTMAMAGQQHRVRDEKHVKKCSNPRYPETHELRAHKGHARLMFFYDGRFEMAIICTNGFFGKGSGSQKQDTAFKHCYELKQIYEITLR